MTTNNSQTCPRCHGTGRNPEDSLLGWPDKPCFVCHGTGQLTPALVNIGGEMDSNKDSVTTQAPGEIVEPTAEEVLSRPHHPLWDKASAATEDMGKLKDEMQTWLEYRVKGNVGEDGLTVFEFADLQDDLAALIAAHDRARLDAVLEAIEDFKTAKGNEAVPRPDVTGSSKQLTWTRGYQRGFGDTMHNLDTQLRPAVKAIFKMEDGE